MARIKFGSIVVEGAGSLGGHTFQNSRGGAQWRTKPINKKKPSLAQSLIRSYNPQLQQGWRDLTEDQRSTWNTYAVSHGKTNKNGDKQPLSGHSLWMQLNFEYISNNLPLQTNVYKAADGPFGAELITNGGFDSPVGWTVGVSWSISGGKANYLDVGTGNILQSALFCAAFYYRVSFDISEVVTFARIGFANQAAVFFFSSPLDGTIDLKNGSYSYDVQANPGTDIIRVYGYVAGSSFSFDNFSIRQIL